MRLVRAELLKARRRQATWVLLIVALVLMGVTFLLVGLGLQFNRLLEFPQMYAIIGQFAFGLGGLFAVVYAAAFVGADWNWGVLRNVIARGESRAGYLLAKAAALAILLAIAALIVFALGMVMVYLTGLVYNVPVASPLRGRGLADLFDNLILGYPVLLQRAALGFAVAVILRSQLAGAVIGIALYVGEAILTTILTGITIAQNLGGLIGEGGFQPIGPEWYQYLPISIGGNVLNALPGGSVATGVAAGGGLEQLFLRPVPLELALPTVLVYMVAAVALGIFALQRQEIV
jgi:hypothetical protein